MIDSMQYSKVYWVHPLYIYRGKRENGREIFEPFWFRGVARLRGLHSFYTFSDHQFGGTLIAWNKEDIQHHARSRHLAYDQLGHRLLIGKTISGNNGNEDREKRVKFNLQRITVIGGDANANAKYTIYSDEYNDPNYIKNDQDWLRLVRLSSNL